MSRILHCAGASAALHKACDLASKLAQAGHQVRVLLTPRAARLVRPQLFEALTGQPCQSSEFGGARRGGMDHIDLATWAELVVVAPCSGDLAGRLAHGLGDDLVTTACLALPAGIGRLLCPAMNPHMLGNPAVQRSLEQLRLDGWRVLPPAEGPLACGAQGQGRMPEPAEILKVLEAMLGP